VVSEQRCYDLALYQSEVRGKPPDWAVPVLRFLKRPLGLLSHLVTLHHAIVLRKVSIDRA
jgi:hypothetical protein